MPSDRRSETHPSVLDPVSAALSLAVPLVLTALRVAPTPNWRDDLAVVRGLGFVPIGGQGTPSAVAMQLLALLPIGGRVLRAGLLGALSAGLAGSAIYALAQDLLRRTGPLSRLGPALSLTAALTATLSPAWQTECVAPGGVALSAALGLALLALSDGLRADDLAAALFRGGLFGLLLAESRFAAGVVLFAMAIRTGASGRVPGRYGFLVALGGAVAVWSFCLVPLIVRPHAEHAWVSFGPGLSGVEEEHRLAIGLRESPIAAWASQVGALAALVGLLGLGWGVWSRPTRLAAIPLAAFAACDCLLAPRGTDALSVDPVVSVRLLAVASLAIGAALAVRSSARALERLRIPFASSAAVLLVVYNFTLVFMAEETSADVVVAADHLAADVWTDDALGELPPNSLLLVHTPTLAWRIWAARTARGERPDLVVVPLGLLDRKSVARSLCDEEPALTPLVRDFAMTGRTSEFSLSALADARPLYVEMDADWDRPLLTHLRPTPLWLGFEAHTLGRSDRTRSLADEGARRAFRRIVGAAMGRGHDDRATLSVLAAATREHAVVLAALGDRDNARAALSDLARLNGESEFAKKLARELDSTARVETRSLLE